MSAPIASYQNPGPDNQPQTLGYHLQAALAIISADRALTMDEMREVQAFNAGVQQIAAQRTATTAEQEPGSETEDYGTSDGVEDVDQDQEGVEPAQAGF